MLQPHVEHRVLIAIRPDNPAFLAEFIPEAIDALFLPVVRADCPDAGRAQRRQLVLLRQAVVVRVAPEKQMPNAASALSI